MNNGQIKKISTAKKLPKDVEKQNRELVRKTIELNELKGQLEDKNIDLEKANEEITNLLKTKIDFMNRAAHDLRTPLTPIITLAPIIENEIKDEKLKHGISIIKNNANYLNKIVKELISIIKSQPNKFEKDFEKINIKDLITEVINNEENVFRSHKIKINEKIPSGLPNIFVDRISITEVLQNIISNAIKFTPNGGTLKATAFKKDNFIYVDIKDSGIGMSKKTLSRLFEPFFKADESRHIEGSGLGLSICKRILENHNGGIKAQSDGPGKGSTITFYLPVGKVN